MNKNLRAIISIVILVICAFLLFRILSQRAVLSKVVKAHDRRAKANTPAELAACRKEYQALLKQGPSGEAKQEIEAGIAACDAWISYHRTSARPTRAKYRETVELMKKAKELTGDPDGIYAKAITQFEARLKEAIGPTAAQMRAQLAALSKLSFGAVVSRLEKTYYWKVAWKRQNRFQDDKARAAALDQVRRYLTKGYVAAFNKTLPLCRKADAELEEQASILGPFGNIKRLDPPTATRLRNQYRKDITRAEAAAKKLEEQMGAH